MKADRRWLFVALLIVVCSARTGTWQAACDRLCLTRIADALLCRHGGARPEEGTACRQRPLHRADGVKPVGDRLWKTASEAPTHFKVSVADPV